MVNGDKEEKILEGDEEHLANQEATEFRRVVARMNFLAQDSPDLQYPVKEVAREMAKPRWGSWGKLKRVVRYLVGRRAVVWHYDWQTKRRG